VFLSVQDHGRKKQLKRVSTTRWSSTEAAVDTVMSRYKDVQDALTELSGPAYNSETITAAVGLKKRLKDFRIVLSMEVLKAVYHFIGPAPRVLQDESVDLATVSTLLDDCRTKFHHLRRNPV